MAFMFQSVATKKLYILAVFYIWQTWNPHLSFYCHTSIQFSGLVLVDCSATYDTVSLLRDAVDHGCCIVLANKKPLTGAYVMLSDLPFSAKNDISWCLIHIVSYNSTKSSHLIIKCVCCCHRRIFKSWSPTSVG
jgi:hypothetical protein